jgi:HlyD family secretion protein
MNTPVHKLPLSRNLTPAQTLTGIRLLNLNLNLNSILSPFLLHLLLLFLATACSPDNDRSDAYGNFEATEIDVSAETSGRLVAFTIEEGQQISAGEVAGMVDTLTLHLNLQQLRAQKASVLSRLDEVRAEAAVLSEQKQLAETESERISRLAADNAATRRQLDDATGRVNVLQRQIEAVGSRRGSIRSEAEVIDTRIELLRDQIRRSSVTSPVSGTVLAKYAEPGEMVSPGKPLFRVAELETMYLRVYVSGSQLPGIEPGGRVEVLIDAPDGTLDSLEGEISWIASRGEFTPRTIQTREDRVNTVYAVKIRVPNDGRLKIGMPGEARFKFR